MTPPNDNTNELLIRIDTKLTSHVENFQEFKEDMKAHHKSQDAKLSAHDQRFGAIDVRMTKQDGKITTGKFWKTFLVIVISLAALGSGLAAWVK